MGNSHKSGVIKRYHYGNTNESQLVNTKNKIFDYLYLPKIENLIIKNDEVDFFIGNKLVI
ncbi:hypothetical protein SAMN04487898_103259 [Pedobacter sp. ok626]|nr:hypothetical protein SAMN04487898_103259 [Pedobacter sp. ok626]